MAVTVTLEEKGRRSDVHWANPNEIILDEKFRGRKYPPTDHEIMEMALSLLKNGQEQPIQVRRDSGNRPICTMGFTRTAAGRLIREGFTDDNGMKHQKKDFQLRFEVSDKNEKEAVHANIVENTHRNMTTVVDDAQNARKMREDHGYSDEELCELFRCSKPYIKQLEKINIMDDKLQLMIHRGKLPIQAALDLIELPAAEQKTVIAQATKANSKVSGKAVRQIVRESHLRDSEKKIAEAPVAGKKKANSSDGKKNKPRSKGEILEWAKSKVNEKNRVKLSNPVAEFMDKLIEWANGSLTDATLDKYFSALD